MKSLVVKIPLIKGQNQIKHLAQHNTEQILNKTDTMLSLSSDTALVWWYQ